MIDIFKTYLGERYAFPAMDRTTGEIRRDLLEVTITEKDRRDVMDILETADLVKFADTVPTPTRKDEDIKMARSYIQETSLVLETVHRNLKDREDAR